VAAAGGGPEPLDGEERCGSLAGCVVAELQGSGRVIDGALVRKTEVRIGVRQKSAGDIRCSGVAPYMCRSLGADRERSWFATRVDRRALKLGSSRLRVQS
jgi:hypothetical protein